MATVKLTDKSVVSAKAKAGQRLELWDSSTPGLCLRVTGSSKVFVYRYRTEDGRQPRLTLGDYSPAFTLADAREAAQRARVQVRAGGDPAEERRRGRALAKAQPLKTFNDLADAFLLASERGEWRPRGKTKRDRTIRDERGILRRHARPVLGELRLEAIDRHAIRGLLRSMAAASIGAQTNRTHAVIRQVLAYGVAEERLTVNAAAGLARVAEEKPRSRVLSDDELAALWSGLNNPAELRLPPQDGKNEGAKVHVSRPVAIALQLCGLLLQRRGEVAGMRLDELDLEQRTWTIPAARMKGGASHLVPLSARAVELVKEALTLAAEGREKRPPVVFPGRGDPTRGVHPDTLSHAMQDVVRALSLKPATPHDLRRTGATNMTSERLAIIPFVVSRVLAHRTDTGGAAAVTLAHYALHDFTPEKRRALEGWEDLLLVIVGERAKPSNVHQLAVVR